MGHGITKDKRETDIRDLDAPEILQFKQVQPSDRFQLKQPEEAQGRYLKEISKNIGNESYNSYNECDYVTDRKDKVINRKYSGSYITMIQEYKENGSKFRGKEVR